MVDAAGSFKYVATCEGGAAARSVRKRTHKRSASGFSIPNRKCPSSLGEAKLDMSLQENTNKSKSSSYFSQLKNFKKEAIVMHRRSPWQKFHWRNRGAGRTFDSSNNASKNSYVGHIPLLAGLVSFIGFSEVRSRELHSAQCETGASPAAARNEYHVGEASVEHKKENEQSSSLTKRFLIPDSYRRRIFFKYERKLRKMSPPEKVFDYFASVRMQDGQKFMTSSDLMRAVVPVFPPSESSLVREGSLPGEQPAGELRCAPSKFFMLFDTNGDGLISFPEYMFLLTLLSIPECSFSTAVRMFDRNGDGRIDREEFQRVVDSMRAHTRKNVRQYDGLRTGLKVDGSVEDCGLVEFFFGKDGKKLLRHEDFEQFLKELHEEIIRLEFSHYDYLDQGTISSKDFGLSMVAAADLSRLNHYLDRVDALGNEESFKDCRVTFEEFHNFSDLRKKLQPLATAINIYGETYGLLTKEDFQRAACQVCKVPLSDKVVDIVFYIFDTNNDGNLSTEEFLGVLERKEHNGSEYMESDILSFLKCWWDCACNCRG
ncbi:hypothetical protein GOP47_0009237 [Adiantum capillus-veneris]|uniref:EF-hand domain-containing protein n=1 Tax=Adiantum capillus-veneris TaxID=13818 RepID=A0A9D4ZJC1_ADICA|nr:hypothetical protein GOP47_0009237 [Adiantum capillus-veneris]